MEERDRKFDHNFFPKPELDDRTFDQMVRDLIVYGFSEKEAREAIEEFTKSHRKPG